MQTNRPEDQLLSQAQEALSTEKIKSQSTQQLVDELTRANVHLRTGLGVMEAKMKEIMAHRSEENKNHQQAIIELKKENEALKLKK